MIYDHISNFSHYCSLHPALPAIEQWLNTKLIQALSLGTYDLPNEVKLILSEYTTQPASQGFIECHRRYIDLQFLLSGEEYIGVAHRQNCESEPYDKANDVQKLTGKLDFLPLRTDNFFLLFPDDAHQPQVQINKPMVVRKAVLKIPF